MVHARNFSTPVNLLYILTASWQYSRRTSNATVVMRPCFVLTWFRPKKRFSSSGSSMEMCCFIRSPKGPCCAVGPDNIKSSTYTVRSSLESGNQYEDLCPSTVTPPSFDTASSKWRSQWAPASGWPHKLFSSRTTGFVYPFLCHEAGQRVRGSRIHAMCFDRNND